MQRLFMSRPCKALLLLAAAFATITGAAAQGLSGPLWVPLNDGEATVNTAEQLLQALNSSLGHITLCSECSLQLGPVFLAL